MLKAIIPADEADCKLCGIFVVDKTEAGGEQLDDGDLVSMFRDVDPINNGHDLGGYDSYSCEPNCKRHT